MQIGGRGILFAIKGRPALAGEDQGGRAGLVADRRFPGLDGLVGISGPDDGQVRNRPQARQVLDRLVGRAIFTETDRIVGQDVDRLQPHHRSEPDRRAHVIGEDQEGAAEGDQAGGVGQAIHEGPHGVLADAEVDVPPDGTGGE